MEDKQNGLKWEERRIIVYSPAYGKKQEAAFFNRLLNVQKDLSSLLQSKQGRKKLDTYSLVQSAVQQVLTKYELKDFIEVNIQQQAITKTIKAYGSRPKRTETKLKFQLQTEINEERKNQHLQNLGLESVYL